MQDSENSKTQQENPDGEDFGALLEESEAERAPQVQRDEKVRGTIVSIGEEWAFVDIGGKSEGTIARGELLDEEGNLTVGVGDPISAYVVRMRDGETLLSIKMTSAAGEEALWDAFRSGVPVEGLVTGERKGGFTVRVFGKDAFCPFSQMDFQARKPAQEYIDGRFTFRIKEYSERGRNIVLSRRDLLEEEHARTVNELKKSLQPGDVVTGRVSNLTHFGAFVDIGGIEGLIPMSELAWYRVEEVSDVLTSGEEVTVQVLNVDWDRNRISLSRKRMIEDPWKSVAARYPEGTVLTGKVKKLMDFGAFVELEPGVEGLVHVSALGAGRRINHPREVVSEGESLDVEVLGVDQGARRISLERKVELQEPETSAEPVTPLNPGDTVTGTVDAVKDYGVFVKLPGDRSGLLHISQIGGVRKEELKRRFPVNSPIDVEILEVEPGTDKISLSTKSLDDRQEQKDFKEFASSTEKPSNAPFGTLGDLLKDKLKK